MLTATITERRDWMGEPCAPRVVTYAVRDAGGYVRLDNCGGPQVMDPWGSGGATAMWTPPAGAGWSDAAEAFERFVRRLRARELRVQRELGR